MLVKSQHFDKPLNAVGSFGYNGEYLIYSDLMEVFADKVKSWVKSDHQGVIMVYGPTGSGKSNWAIQFCRTLNRDWDIKTNLLYGLEDLKTKLRSSHPDPINLFDEGSIIFNSLDTMSKDSKTLAVLFDMLRSRHMISVIVMPSDKELNKRIGKHVDWWVECPAKAPLPGYTSRGFFHVRTRTLYRSGKTWESLLGTGVYFPISAKMNTIYQNIKRQKQDEYMRSVGLLE